MTADQSQHLLQSATWDDDGTFILLRLGEDPGKDRITQLRQALYVLWLHWKDQPSLPYELCQNAAMIVVMHAEATFNLKASKVPLRPALLVDLERLRQSAYQLLQGRFAEDTLGRNGEKWKP